MYGPKSHNVKFIKRLSIHLDETPPDLHKIPTINFDGTTSNFNNNNNNDSASATLIKSPRRIFRTINAPCPLSSKNYYRRPIIEGQLFNAIMEVCDNPDKGALLITGHSGVGLTTTIAQILDENKVKGQTTPASSSILAFWLNCSQYRDFEVEDDDKIEQLFNYDLVELAKLADPVYNNPDPSEITGYFKEKKNCRVLFVFDDMFNFKLNKKNQPSLSCCVITPKLELLRQLDTMRRFENLADMNDVDVKTLLKGKLMLMSDDEQLTKLAECCYGLPLIANLIAAGYELGADTWDYDGFLRKVAEILEQKLTLQEKQFRTVVYLFQTAVRELHHQWRKCYYAFLMFNPGEQVSFKDLELFWARYSLVSSHFIIEFFEARGLINRSPDCSRLTIHPLLFEAALETAGKEYQQFDDNSCDSLQLLRLRLLTYDAEGEMILFAIVRFQRYDLLKRIVDKVNAENLAQLCKKLSAIEDEGANRTFLQFLYKFKWQVTGLINPSYLAIRDILVKILKHLTAKEVLNVVNAPSEDGTSSFLTDFFDDETTQPRNERQPLLLLLNRWQLVYINHCWKRILAEECGNKLGSPLLVAILNNNETELEKSFDKVDEEVIKEAFNAAARCNQVDMVERIFRKSGEKTPPPLDDNDIQTALMFSAAAGYLNVVKFLSENSQNVVASRDLENRTPLFVACENGHLDVAEYLYERYDKAVALTDSSGRTPLWAAAHNGNLDVVRFLCDKYDANIFLQDSSQGTTPLWIASRNGHLLVVRFLCETKSALINDRSRQSSPFWAAAANDQMEVVRYLGELDPDGSYVSVPNVNGETPLWIAARNGHFDVVKYICKKEWGRRCIAQLDNNNGTTPLYNAAETGHVQIVRFLAEKDFATVTQKNAETGATPLWAAAASGHLQTVTFLYECDKNCVLQADDEGITPLWIAAANGYVNIVKFLYEKDKRGAIMPENDGIEPIIVAASNGHVDVVEFLEKCANVK